MMDVKQGAGEQLHGLVTYWILGGISLTLRIPSYDSVQGVGGGKLLLDEFAEV